MSKYEPNQLGSRLFDACVSICAAATALYVAVWLVAQVWLWLVGITALVGGVAIARRLTERRTDRW